MLLAACAVTARVSYAQDNDAKVYFILSTGFRGSPLKYQIFVDQVRTCGLVNDSFHVHHLRAGRHTFNAQFTARKLRTSSKPITIDVEAGKTYYVELMQNDFLMCQEVTENSAKAVLASCAEQANGF